MQLAIPYGLRRFVSSDYFGYAGAEKLPDGSEPLLGDLRVVHDKFLQAAEVVASGDGEGGVAVGIHTIGAVRFAIFPARVGLEIAHMLGNSSEPIHSETLIVLGFQEQ